MKINIEIDVTPQELRAFLGLPDVSAVQDDILRAMRERMSEGVEGLDPATFFREATSDSARAWQRLMNAAFGGAAAGRETRDADADEASPPRHGSASATRRSRSRTPDRNED